MANLKKDPRTTFRMKRQECVDVLKEQAAKAQKFFEEACDDISPTRAHTLIMLAKESGPISDIIQDACTELEIAFDLAESEFRLFEEIGRNSIAGVVIQLEKIQAHEPIIESLAKRDLKVFVLYQNGSPELKLWKNAFSKVYKLPDEFGRLISGIRDACC